MVKSRKSILFFTNSEHGQANVMLAVAHEFLLRNEFDIHFATFSDGQARISQFNEAFATRYRAVNEASSLTDNITASTATEASPSLVFHPVAGRSSTEVFDSKPDFTVVHGVGGIRETLKTYNDFIDLVLYWEPDQYIKSYQSCVEIIKTVRPSFAVCDPVFYLGRDAVVNSQVPYAILSPTCFKDFVLQIQPNLAALWKYPA
jgi:hypothetical protein